MSRSLHSLLAAQFVSGLADNALLLVAIACVVADDGPAWLPPLLKLVFTLAYVVLAPFVGPLADRWPKARVMFAANALKALACAAMTLGLPALAAFTLAGIGAALYSPAKYGLVTELVPAQRLVVANAWLEVSTVVAILLGTLLGGVLTDQPFVDAASLFVTQGLAVSLAVVLLLYVLAAGLNLRVPHSGCRYPPAPDWQRQVRAFLDDNLRLWRDPLGQVSLATTTLFWGVGAMLQFAALRWADECLGLALSGAAYLQGLAAVGVMAGAALAGRCVPLRRAPQVLGLGVLLGLLMPAMLLVHTVWQGALLLSAIGFVGGFFVVPMNALLQWRGVRLLSAGRSIAVQNFNENASVLVVLASYSLSMAHGVSLPVLLCGAGTAVAGAMALVGWRWRQINGMAWQREEAQAPSS